MPMADVAAPRIVLVAGMIGATVVLAVLAVLGLLRHWQLPPGAEAPAPAPPLPAATAPLASAPQDDLAALQRAWRRELGTLEWADRARGLVRVPIDQAIALRAQPASEATR